MESETTTPAPTLTFDAAPAPATPTLTFDASPAPANLPAENT